MEVYKDLRRSDEDRDNRQEFGLANENVRKLVSKDDSGNKATKTDGVLDLTIANMCDRMKIPLGKILCDHGPYAPYGMCNFEYKITLPQSKKIMKAQNGEDIGEYKLTDMHLEYEIIERSRLVGVPFNIRNLCGNRFFMDGEKLSIPISPTVSKECLLTMAFPTLDGLGFRVSTVRTSVKRNVVIQLQCTG